MNKNAFVIALLKCKGIGPAKTFKYIKNNNFDYDRCLKNINTIVDEKEFQSSLMKASEEIQHNLNKRIKIISVFSQNFPSKLYTISDPILYLYYYGNISLLNKQCVGIIGTRKPSAVSISSTKLITKEIQKKYVTVAGLALGIDSFMHKETILNGGETIAVLPSSIDNIQPVSNKDLAREIIRNKGLLITEYSTGTPLSKFNYPRRDRIQAALSCTIIVPEASEKSGTMITVKEAMKEGKKVFQLISNENRIIQNKINLNDDFMFLITFAIDEFEANQIIKRKEENYKKIEQESLF